MKPALNGEGLLLLRVLPATRVDPDSEQLHAMGPIQWSPQYNRWLVFAHAAVRDILQDDAFLVEDRVSFGLQRLEDAGGICFPAIRSFLSHAALTLNPPAHEPARRLLIRTLGQIPLAVLRDFAHGVATSLTEAAARRGEFDLVGDYTRKLPIAVVGRLLGVPDTDLPMLADAADAFVSLLDAPLLALREYRRIEAQAQLATAYFTDLLKQRRRAPAEDGVTMILAAHAGTNGSDDDIEGAAATCAFLLTAGAELTAGLLASGAARLLRDAALCARLRRRPDELGGFVDLVLREDPPVHCISRLAATDRVVHGQPIAAGERVTLFLAAANRGGADDTTLPPLLSFGDGRHVCLGGALARMEAAVAFAALLALPNPVVDEASAQWSSGRTIRTLARLTVRVGSPDA